MLKWLSQNSDLNSAVVAHYALFDLASVYASNKHVELVPTDSSIWSNKQNESALANAIVQIAQKVSAEGYTSVYTVWWVNGQGWYGIPTLPSDFTEIYRVGNIAVYSFSEGVQ